MAIHYDLARIFSRYIPPDEEILATLYYECQELGRSQRVCVTNKRFALLEKKGLFSWSYYSGEFAKIRTVSLDQGIFKSKIRIYAKDGFIPILSNVNKQDAREFVSILDSCISQDNEILSQRTKVCPMCDEIIKYKAKKCKYCGYFID